MTRIIYRIATPVLFDKIKLVSINVSIYIKHADLILTFTPHDVIVKTNHQFHVMLLTRLLVIPHPSWLILYWICVWLLLFNDSDSLRHCLISLGLQ